MIYIVGILALTHVCYPGFAGSPAWSPDGTMIVYDVYTGPYSIQLAVMHADGSNPIVIWHQAPSTNFFAASAAWGTAP